MSNFTFTLTPNGIAQIHDALGCLSKFDENITLEATDHELRISSLNSTKTGYASFIFQAATFFEKYHFGSGNIQIGRDATKTWSCKVQNRALLSIFRRRQADSKERETSIEKCEFELQARPEETECRLIFRLLCRMSVTKIYKLIYESTEILSATFDKQNSPNTWTIAARTLKDIAEYFGPKTEHVDWSLDGGKMIFTSYAEKIQVGREIIRQPTHTSVTLSDKDFDECRIEAAQHISIPVKDFRSIVMHADAMKAKLTVTYSRGHRPLRIEYASGGLEAQFTLMTRGTNSAVTENSRAGTPARMLSVRPTTQTSRNSRAPSAPAQNRNVNRVLEPQSQSQLNKDEDEDLPQSQSGPLPATGPPPPSTNIDPESLFFPAAETEDQQWDPPNFDDDRAGIVTWDNTGTNTFDPSTISSRRGKPTDDDPTSFRSAIDRQNGNTFEFEPTQRLSQIRGIFD